MLLAALTKESETSYLREQEAAICCGLAERANKRRVPQASPAAADCWTAPASSSKVIRPADAYLLLATRAGGWNFLARVRIQPDSLSVEAIRQGRTGRRNPTLTEHAAQFLPYRGLGSGIPRALREWPQIELLDDAAGN